MSLLNHTAVLANSYLSEVGNRPVKAMATSAELRAALGGPLGESGEAPVEIIDRLARAATDGTVASAGPRYFGFVVGGSLPAAVAADWLVSTWDQNAGIYALSPMVSVVEDITAGWLRSLAGLPDTMSVGFVTGCQMANFTALAAARHHVLRHIGWDVEAKGLSGAPEVTVITSDESHYTIFMALRLLGFGAATARRVPTDDQGRMRADKLREILTEVSGPVIVCAQAGNVNTGAFDPIDEIATILAQWNQPAWLHVDGAFGLWAATSSARAHLVKGIERADSIATDGHKWLNVPYDSGIVFCAHPESHRGAMSLSAAYIQATAVERDPHEFVLEVVTRSRCIYAARFARHSRRGRHDRAVLPTCHAHGRGSRRPSSCARVERRRAQSGARAI
jgi:glutamate/tyrosine decarboxylase-like PLP-dependent enzyme